MFQLGKPFVDSMVFSYCAIGLAVLFTVEFIMENRQKLYRRLAWAYDFALGEALQFLADNARSGLSRKNREIAETVSPDILVIGSSRAFYHYVPSIIEDSLGGSVYVAGENGCGIVMMNPLLHYISARHKPDVVIYDMTPDLDFMDDDPHRYIKSARCLWGRNSYMDSVICMVDPTERFKLHSRLFRFNSLPTRLIKDCIVPIYNIDRGYSPLYGKLDPQGQRIIHFDGTFETSPLKLRLLKELIDFCRKNDIQLIFAISPYYGNSTENFSAYVSVIQKFGGRVLNFGSLEEISSPEYFNDACHLNHTGACIYTDTLVSHIRRLQQTASRSGSKS